MEKRKQNTQTIHIMTVFNSVSVMFAYFKYKFTRPRSWEITNNTNENSTTTFLIEHGLLVWKFNKWNSPLFKRYGFKDL